MALAAAAGLALAGLRAGGGDGVVLEVDDAVASVVPSTVRPNLPAAPPISAPEVVTVGAGEPADVTSLPDVTTTTERVEVRELVDIGEATRPRPQPVGLAIDTIDVAHYPIRQVGLADDGQLEVPDETEIGWYKYGATAGAPGATVMAAHVNWRGSQGPFARLGTVEPGDSVEVTLDDGTTRVYEVTERTMYGKLALPRERIWRNTGPEELVLITCGGEFNPELRSYKHNIVVYAVPVA